MSMWGGRGHVDSGQVNWAYVDVSLSTLKIMFAGRICIENTTYSKIYFEFFRNNQVKYC